MKVKQYRKILIVVLMICAAIFFGCVERLLSSQLSTQQVAKEWSEDKNYAQISCFFTEETAITRDQIVMYEQKLQTALQEAAEVTNDANEPAVISPLLIKYVPTPRTVAIPNDAIIYIIGLIQPERLYKDIFTLNDFQVWSLKYLFCRSCSS